MTTFWTTAEAFLADKPKETQKIIDPMLAYGGATCLLYGPRASGKTQIALSMAIAISRGEPWLGLFPTKQARVAFIELDMPHQTMHERLAMLNGELRGAPISMTLWDRSFDIVKGRNIMTLGSAMAQAPEFVIVESLRKSHREDENDSNTPSLVYKLWQDRFPGASFTFSHHDRKMSLDPKAAMKAKDEAFRGSGAWIDDADLGLHLIPESSSLDLEEMRVRLEFARVRSCPPQPPLSLAFNEHTLLPYVIDPTPETQLRAELLKRDMLRPEAVAFLQELGVKERTAWRIAERLGLARAHD